MRAIYVNAKDAAWDDLRRELAELRAAAGPEAEIYFDEQGWGRRFQALIARLKSGAVDEVLVYAPERIGNPTEVRRAVRQIEAAGGRLVFLSTAAPRQT
jgi:hypothetical protein